MAGDARLPIFLPFQTRQVATDSTVVFVIRLTIKIFTKIEGIRVLKGSNKMHQNKKQTGDS